MEDLLYKVVSNNPDIIFITETKLEETIGNEGLPTKFQIIRRDRDGGIGRGGGWTVYFCEK